MGLGMSLKSAFLFDLFDPVSVLEVGFDQAGRGIEILSPFTLVSSVACRIAKFLFNDNVSKSVCFGQLACQRNSAHIVKGWISDLTPHLPQMTNVRFYLFQSSKTSIERFGGRWSSFRCLEFSEIRKTFLSKLTF